MQCRGCKLQGMGYVVGLAVFISRGHDSSQPLLWETPV
jgi:hypothetical protein